MTLDQILITAILAATLAMFVWGRFRHDVVAVLALVAATGLGLVPAREMFSGFGHSATITVALVLILGRGLQNAGVVDLIAKYMLPPIRNPVGHIGIVSSVAGALSAVMNNVGALAILMPATLASAQKVKRSASMILMPLSFGSILGGLITLIGTPPNIIVATIRRDISGEPFGMFDFTPVGAAIAVGGLLFVALVGWRLIPKDRRPAAAAADAVSIEDYVTAARIGRDSKSGGKTLSELDKEADKLDIAIIEVVRRGRRLALGRRSLELRTSDLLLLEGGPEAIEKAMKALELTSPTRRKKSGLLLGGEDIGVMEAVIQPQSRLIGNTTSGSGLRSRFGVNVLAVSRAGSQVRSLRDFTFRAGDVILMEGENERLPAAASHYRCLPLASRAISMGKIHLTGMAMLIFAAAIAAAAFGLLPLPLAFAMAAVLMVLVNIVPLREIYDSIDWPVVVLIGAMIPVGNALQQTGATTLFADGLLSIAWDAGPVIALVLVMVVTMTLSDAINNAATAVVMAPIGVRIAEILKVSPDTFLMGVAIAASCAFLTPIGHQNNTIIMGPGGYKFGDYWRLGLPIELVVLAIGVPLLLVVWPLHTSG